MHSTEIGVAFCSGGRYATTRPSKVPTVRTGIRISDPTCTSRAGMWERRGVTATGITVHCWLTNPRTGGFFLIGGVILFFDRAMLAMGNVSASPSLPLHRTALQH